MDWFGFELLAVLVSLLLIHLIKKPKDIIGDAPANVINAYAAVNEEEDGEAVGHFVLKLLN